MAAAEPQLLPAGVGGKEDQGETVGRLGSDLYLQQAGALRQRASQRHGERRALFRTSCRLSMRVVEYAVTREVWARRCSATPEADDLGPYAGTFCEARGAETAGPFRKIAVISLSQTNARRWPNRALVHLWRDEDGVRRSGSWLAKRLRAILSSPSDVASVFWAGGVLATASAVALGRWSGGALLVLGAVAALCACVAGVRLVVGRRLPRWVLHVDAALATALASVLTVVGVSGHVDFADLYIWVVLFAALFFSPAGMLAHTSGVGAAYAIALALGPAQPDPALAWLAVCVSAAIPGIVVLGLVGALRSTALEDPLTGLANRRAWDERLEEELARALRTGQELSVAIIDLDDFKTINDQAGHESGDRMLQRLAETWASEVRHGGDVLARLGGDEFGLIAPGSSMTDIRRLSRRLSSSAPDGLSVSIGTATWNGVEHAGKLVRRADRLMYRNKRGRHKAAAAASGRHRHHDGSLQKPAQATPNLPPIRSIAAQTEHSRERDE